MRRLPRIRLLLKAQTKPTMSRKTTKQNQPTPAGPPKPGTPHIFEEIQAAAIPMANHESDLYFECNPASRAILNRHPDKKQIARGFIHQQLKTRWIEVPFAYLPWWEKRQSAPTGQ
jgi:hypothetical protein